MFAHNPPFLCSYFPMVLLFKIYDVSCKAGRLYADVMYNTVYKDFMIDFDVKTNSLGDIADMVDNRLIEYNLTVSVGQT